MFYVHDEAEQQISFYTERLKLCCILNKLCRMALTMVTETSYIVLLKVIHICMPVCI